MAAEQAGLLPPVDPNPPPVDNPETIPAPQTTGEQLALNPPYAG